MMMSVSGRHFKQLFTYMTPCTYLEECFVEKVEALSPFATTHNDRARIPGGLQVEGTLSMQNVWVRDDEGSTFAQVYIDSTIYGIQLCPRRVSMLYLVKGRSTAGVFGILYGGSALYGLHVWFDTSMLEAHLYNYVRS